MKLKQESITFASEYIGKTVVVTVDRPLGSKHPKFDWTYPINYGFVPGTLSPDGEKLDAYVIGVSEPLEQFTGICIALIHRTNDDDDKLIVVPEEKKGMTNEEIREATEFQEKYFESEIMR
jgi:inorganic pyrophosphatase